MLNRKLIATLFLVMTVLFAGSTLYAQESTRQTTSRQTQQPTYGEKVQSGGQKAGLGVAGGVIPGGSIISRSRKSGSIVAQAATSEAGKFDLGILPAGVYELSVQVKSSNVDPKSAKLEGCVVVVQGASGGPVIAEWDLKLNKAARIQETPENARMRILSDNKTRLADAKIESGLIIIESDGKTSISGTLKTKHDTAKNSINNVR
ncbi:MAG: hypothetical protein IPO77_06155 [Acidobacteria bacterium]|nr:hypothetical protein [Acidobacteriota bacterium]